MASTDSAAARGGLATEDGRGNERAMRTRPWQSLAAQPHDAIVVRADPALVRGMVEASPSECRVWRLATAFVDHDSQ